MSYLEHNKRNEKEVNRHVKHSQEKKKYTQDLGYPNLPQQQYCPSATVALLIMKILHRALFLAYKDEFFH